MLWNKPREKLGVKGWIFIIFFFFCLCCLYVGLENVMHSLFGLFGLAIPRILEGGTSFSIVFLIAAVLADKHLKKDNANLSRIDYLEHELARANEHVDGLKEEVRFWRDKADSGK